MVTLCVTIPLYVLFQYNYAKAVQAGIIVPSKPTRTFMESLKHYTIEFDVGGLVLAMAGMVIFLLPFNLYSKQENGWKSPFTISMLIIGFLLLLSFVLYERYVAPKTIIPYRFLLDRTVIGACLLAAILFVSWYLWHSFFPSFLQVVNGLNITHATYILNIYSVGACFFSIFVGLGIRWTGRFKWIALYFGVPAMMLGIGLLIYFRQPGVGIEYVAMTQLIIAFAGGACVISEQIAVMAATDHQYIAVVLAIEGMFSSIGGGIGSSIAVTIWTSVFPKKLAEYLPAEAQDSLWDIYASLNTQLSYHKGTPTRAAIELAYSDAQKYMNMAGTAILFLAFPAVMMWRDTKVKDFKQMKGRVV
jgi:MFS family permease